MARSGMRESLLLLLSCQDDGGNALSIFGSKRQQWPGHKTESVVAMINKMKKEGEIREDMRGLLITSLGKKALEKFVPLREFSSSKWDGWWRLIVFDIPEKKRGKRDLLRRFLHRYGFGVWQKSMYITPHDIVRGVNKYLKDNDLSQQVICLECRQIGGMRDEEVASSVYKIDERLARYWKLVKKGEQLVEAKVSRRETADWLDDWKKESLADPLLPRELDSAGVIKLREQLAKLVKKIIEKED